MTLDWNTDYWATKPPRVHAPAPQVRVPKPVPEPQQLFTIQRHLLDALHIMRDPGRDKHMDQLEALLENTYRVVNTYLKTNVAPSQGVGATL